MYGETFYGRHTAQHQNPCISEEELIFCPQEVKEAA